MTVLEFGIGMSTIVMDDAIQINKEKYEDFVKKIYAKIMFLKSTQLTIQRNGLSTPFLNLIF